MHPETQHQVINTRTDLDRFSDLEVSGLIRHGYGVMRNVARSRPDLFGDRLPDGPPWDPTTLSMQGREDRRSRLTFPILGPTDVATMWVLLPPGKPYQDVEIVAYRTDRSSLVEAVEPTYRFNMADGSLFGWMLVAPREGHTYECRWSIGYDTPGPNGLR